MTSKSSLIAAALLSATVLTALPVSAASDVTDATLAEQRAALAKATKDAGFGPQSPRDIDTLTGKNTRIFGEAPASSEMNLCNIHFHEGAEHKGGQFDRYIGNGNGKGYGTGFRYSGTLTEAELAPLDEPIADKGDGNGGLKPWRHH